MPNKEEYCPPLTASFVKKVREPGTYAHGKFGLYLRVRAKGAKSYVVIAKAKGSRTTVTATIGSTKSYPLKLAERAAEKLYHQIREGASPARDRKKRKEEEEKRQREEAAKNELTLEAAFQLFLQFTNTKGTTKRLYEVEIRKHLSDWLSRPMLAITENDVLERHRQLNERPGVATLTMHALSSVFTLCQTHPKTKALITANPVQILSKMKAWATLEPRRSAIQKKELPAWWRTVSSLEDDTLRDCLQLLLLTGLRKNTLCRLQWSHVTMGEGEGKLEIPAEIDKEGRRWTLPLGRKATEILKARKDASQSNFILPGTRTRKFFNCRKELCDKVASKSGVHFTPHSLRHTFLTHAGLSCPELAAKRLAGHSTRGNVIFFHYFEPEFGELQAAMQNVEDSILKAAEVVEQEICRLEFSRR